MGGKVKFLEWKNIPACNAAPYRKIDISDSVSALFFLFSTSPNPPSAFPAPSLVHLPVSWGSSLSSPSCSGIAIGNHFRRSDSELRHRRQWIVYWIWWASVDLLGRSNLLDVCASLCLGMEWYSANLFCNCFVSVFFLSCPIVWNPGDWALWNLDFWKEDGLAKASIFLLPLGTSCLYVDSGRVSTKNGVCN